MEAELFKRASPDFRMFACIGNNGEVDTSFAGCIPLPMWPDGRWCFEIAAYVANEVGKGLSLAGRGGSAATYASQLSHICRYCHANELAFLEVTDSRFRHFINFLTAETRFSYGCLVPVRSSTQVGTIAKRTLDFLSELGRMFGFPDYVGEEGVICAVKKQVAVKTSDGRTRAITSSWHHPAIPSASVERSRHPISDEYIHQLRGAIQTRGGTTFRRRRSQLIIRLLEKTGCRRIELVGLSAHTILDAQREAEQGRCPTLTFETYKKRKSRPIRKVEVASEDLAFCVEYIHKYLVPLLDRLNIKFDRNTKLFVSERTGNALAPNTITQEIRILRMVAGILGKAHPHLFRHRFITNILVAFIRAERTTREAIAKAKGESLSTVDSFMREYLNVATFRKKVMEMTGHSSEDSINRYVHWAYAKVSNYDDSVKVVKVIAVLESLSITLDELESEREKSSDQIEAMLASVKLTLKDLRQLKEH